MNNTKLPAYPLPLVNNSEGEIKDASDWDGTNVGFTKLELASIMIAQGMVQRQDREYDPETTKGVEAISGVAVHLAKAVLEEANK